MASVVATQGTPGDGATNGLVATGADSGPQGPVFPASVGSGARLGRGIGLPMAVVLHTFGAALIVLLPLMTSEPLPEPTSALRAFFVAPTMMAPPPPPPPPAPRPAETATKIAPQTSPQFIAPFQIPNRVETRTTDDSSLGMEGGVPGGVEGGVLGGVVGGVVGGLGTASAPPPPSVVRVGGDVKEPRKLKNVVPIYPEVARLSRIEGTIVLEATIGPKGKVEDVKVLHDIPLLTDAASAAVKKWEYTPTLVGGVPVSAIMTVTVTFRLDALATL